MPANGGPSGSVTAACAYDEHNDRIVFFGGGEGSELAPTPTGTWAWNGTGFTSIAAPAASPPPRTGGAMVYDFARKKIVFFGGRTALGQAPTDVWELDASGWHQVVVVAAAAGQKPPGRRDHAMAYDHARKRTVVFGGSDATNTTQFDDLWEWDGSTWRKGTSGSTLSRWRAATGYAPGLGVLMHGGSTWARVSAAETLVWDGTTLDLLGGAEMPAPTGPAVGAVVPGHGFVVYTINSTGIGTWTRTTWLRPATRNASWRNVEATGNTPGVGACLAYMKSRHRVVAIDGDGNVSELGVNTVPNRRPQLAPIGDQTVWVGDPLHIDLAATDEDGDELTYVATQLPAGASLSGSAFDWTPTIPGTYRLRFSATDSTATTATAVTVRVLSNTYSVFPQSTVHLGADAVGVGHVYHNCQNHPSRTTRGDGCANDPGGTVVTVDVVGNNPGKIELRLGLSRPAGRVVKTVLEANGTFAIAWRPSSASAAGIAARGAIVVESSGDYHIRFDQFRQDFNEREYVRATSSSSAPLVAR